MKRLLGNCFDIVGKQQQRHPEGDEAAEKEEKGVGRVPEKKMPLASLNSEQPGDKKRMSGSEYESEGSSCTQEEQSESEDSLIPERGQWSGKLDFIFGCISYAVGLGNVWRFPYLCYENGGGAFLVPYFLCIFLCGIPLFLLEVSLGQYLNTGGIGIWNLVPMFKGVGYASMTMIGLCNIYYIVLISWTFFYFVASFSWPLPWEGCDNSWNTDQCMSRSVGPPSHAVNISTSTASFIQSLTTNITLATTTQIPPINFSPSSTLNVTAATVATSLGRAANETVSPVKEYWERRVLEITDGLEHLGSVRGELALYLLLAWFLVYVVIWRGLHQSGKIIWFTAMFPYVILLVLFFRGVTLEGASTGLLYYIEPKWEKLKEAKVWVSAGTQVLFSYGIGIGANIALGSYNRYHHNFYRDSLLACCISSGTSLFSGVVIFSVLGHMAHVQGKDISEVARSGPGLAFLAYPEVVTQLPLSPLWSVLFFLMLIVLGTDSQFCTVEAFVTGIVDEWATFLRPRRKLFTLGVVISQYLLGLPLVAQGGMYLFQLMDFYSASGFSLLTVVFFEIIGIAWIYGARRIYHNMNDMLGFRPNFYFYFCWVFAAPLVIVGIFLFSVVKYEHLTYADTYTYPWWGETMGWGMAMASVIWIPAYAIYYLATASGTWKERLVAGITPLIPPPAKERPTPPSETDEIPIRVTILPTMMMPKV